MRSAEWLLRMSLPQVCPPGNGWPNKLKAILSATSHGFAVSRFSEHDGYRMNRRCVLDAGKPLILYLRGNKDQRFGLRFPVQPVFEELMAALIDAIDIKRKDLFEI